MNAIRLYRNKPERMEIRGYVVCWKYTYEKQYGAAIVYKKVLVGPFELLIQVHEGAYEATHRVESYSEDRLRLWFEETVRRYEDKLEAEAKRKAAPAQRFCKKSWWHK